MSKRMRLFRPEVLRTEREKQQPMMIPEKMDEAFEIKGGTYDERVRKVRELKEQYPSLKHRFEISDPNVTWLFLSSKPLRADQTERYVRKLAKNQRHVYDIEQENPATRVLALS